MIADRYQRRPQPKLELLWRHTTHESAKIDGYRIELTFSLRNIGQGMALYPAVKIHRNELFDYPSLSQSTRSSSLEYQRPHFYDAHHFFRGNINDVIYPGETMQVATIEGYIHRMSILTSTTPVKINYQVYCDGFYGEGSYISDTRYLAHHNEGMN